MKLALFASFYLYINLITAFPQNDIGQSEKCSDNEFHRYSADISCFNNNTSMTVRGVVRVGQWVQLHLSILKKV